MSRAGSPSSASVRRAPTLRDRGALAAIERPPAAVPAHRGATPRPSPSPARPASTASTTGPTHARRRLREIVARGLSQAARARRGALRRARLPARGRAHGRAAARRRAARRRRARRSSPRCRTSTWPGRRSASTRWPPACGSSTGTASPSRRPVSVGPLLVAQCDRQSVLSEIKLAVERRARPSPCCSGSACPTRRCATVAWADLDRAVDARPPDHRSGSRRWPTRWGPSWCGSTSWSRTLRSACPWDREQTHASLTRHLLEETYEVLDAIDHLDVDDRRRLRPPRGGARRPALPGRVPLGARRRGGPVHPGRRGPRHPRQARGPPSPRVRTGGGRAPGERRRRRSARGSS